MRTPQWIKKLGGHAGELYVAAELSKRGIPNSLFPENFSDDDILIGKKDGTEMAFMQVKSCHPEILPFLDFLRIFPIPEFSLNWVIFPVSENLPIIPILEFFVIFAIFSSSGIFCR